MQLDRFPTESELDAAYADAESDDYVEEEAGQRHSFAGVLERIERYAPDRGAILDVGCWVGFLLAEARERGWDEASGSSRRRSPPSTPASGSGSTCAPRSCSPPSCRHGHFDAVVMGDVLEHLTQRQRGARTRRASSCARAACSRSSSPTPAAASPACSAPAGGP